jgi:inhibitor of growth protein 3
MQAKDQQIQDLRTAIQQRDSSLQKFIKLNGSLVQNPKEEPYSKVIMQNYERAQVLQEEKIGLSEKAAALVRHSLILRVSRSQFSQLDRYVKRLDIKLRDLQNDGSLPFDPLLPSLLRDSPGNRVPPLSMPNTGTSTPLHPVSGNHGGGAPNLAQAAAIARITNATNANLNSRLNPSLQNMQTQALLNQQRLTNAQSAIQANARQEREMSAGSDSKRRRPTGSIGPLPSASSNLGRQGSLGPGTPKPSTPGSRAGSVGPRPQKHPLTVKKAKPQQPLRKAALTAKSGVNKKRRKGGSRASPSTTADDESVASEAGTEDEDLSGVGGGDADEDESDDTKYCFCQRVSFGDMVACDNDSCQYQWFHWECVGIKEEPVGDWLCPDCRKQPSNKIKRAR